MEKGEYLPQLPEVVPSMENRPVSIFDISAFYAASVPPAEFSDSRLRQLSSDVFAYLVEEIGRIEDSTEVLPVLEAILNEQVQRFEGNIDAYRKDMGTPFTRRLRTILRPIEEQVTELGLRNWTQRLKELQASLSKQDEAQADARSSESVTLS